jgi:hypothetical protein
MSNLVLNQTKTKSWFIITNGSHKLIGNMQNIYLDGWRLLISLYSAVQYEVDSSDRSSISLY